MTEKVIYVLVPGYVASRSDGDTHYITAGQLRELYGASPSQCVKEPFNKEGWEPPEGAIYLRPRYDGDYSLPVEEN